MAKLDIKHAFRLCPVRLEDRELLGIHWQGQYYIDLRLPFGMRSSPYLFNRLADAFEWLLKTNYHIQDLMHYLDDYFTVGPANSLVCAHNVHTITQVASQVGIPLAPNKLEGPTTQLVFLGILIDTTRMETSLPDDKLHELLSELRSWSSCKKCLKRELLSLIGKLNFACRIIPAGRIFLRRLIDLSTQARLPHHHVTMNREARRDISWWLRFSPLLERPCHHTRPQLDEIPRYGTLHRRLRKPRLWHLLHGSLDCQPLASSTPEPINSVERTLPHCSGVSSLGSSVDRKEAPLSLR